jgi:hypothetical protein
MAAPKRPQVLRIHNVGTQKEKFVRIMAPQALASAFFLALLGLGANAEDKSEERLWQQTLDAREKYFTNAVGPLPQDIIKMRSMAGVWPGGGLFVIPAPRLGSNMAVYSTSGLTNSDMPTDVRIAGFKRDSAGNQVAGRLKKKERARQPPGAAGYGYELMVVAQKGVDWPMGLLQWAVNQEIADDAGLLSRVEKYGGFTAEQIDVGESGPINVLISKALSPLPTGTQLPAGKMEILVATVITPEEMRWSRRNRRDALLQRLKDAGVGQVSKLKRESVVR